MATIDDLNKSITEMSQEELLAKIRELRQSRRTLKDDTKSAKKVAARGGAPAKPRAKQPPKEVDMKSLFASMTPEQRLKMLEELE